MTLIDIVTISLVQCACYDMFFLDARSCIVPIPGLQPDTEIWLMDNSIQELTEESFRFMLEILSFGTGYIWLSG